MSLLARSVANEAEDVLGLLLPANDDGKPAAAADPSRDILLRYHWLPQPRILHPWSDQRFAVRYPHPGAGSARPREPRR